ECPISSRDSSAATDSQTTNSPRSIQQRASWWRTGTDDGHSRVAGAPTESGNRAPLDREHHERAGGSRHPRVRRSGGGTQGVHPHGGAGPADRLDETAAAHPCTHGGGGARPGGGDRDRSGPV